MIFIPIIIGFILSTAWIVYEFINAPLMDDDGNIIEDENG
jgi:hypothetical protein